MKFKPLRLALLISMALGCQKDNLTGLELQERDSSSATQPKLALTNSNPLEVFNAVGDRMLLAKDKLYTNNEKFSNSLITPIPAGYNDAITRIRLKQGYQVVLSENSNGSGASKFYLAKTSTLDITLPSTLTEKVSFIRCLPIDEVQKKGTGYKFVNPINALASTWYYNWSNNPVSGANGSHTPMLFGGYAVTNANISALISTRKAQVLSFNEPDNPKQSNMPNVTNALDKYKESLYCGMRMGSPVCEQGETLEAGSWLRDFMDGAKDQKLPVHFIAVHWYDWDNWDENESTDQATAQKVLDRFIIFIEAVRNQYNRPIWVTEFNANLNRPYQVHQIFMELASDWLNHSDQNYVERYAYFFPAEPPSLQPAESTTSRTLTALGLTWNGISSPSFRSGNMSW